MDHLPIGRAAITLAAAALLAPLTSVEPSFAQNSDATAPAAQPWAAAHPYQRGFSPHLAVEPIVGRLFFAEELGLARQEVLGVSGGVHFTPAFGLRGFYWRGINSGFTAIEPVQSYGGEVQLTLGASGVVFPFLLLGAGQLDFREGYLDQENLAPSDRTFLILGAGLGFAVGERLRLNFAVRDYVLAHGDLQELGRGEAITHNPLLNLGLTFAVGGRMAPAGWAEDQRSRLRADTERAFAERDRFLAELRERSAEAAARRAAGEAAGERRATQRDLRVEQDRGRVVSIPVPEQGEIYIRYGTPGAVRIERDVRTPDLGAGRPALTPDTRGFSPAELREIVRDVVREEFRGATAPRATDAPPRTAPLSPAIPSDDQLEQLELQLMRRMDELIQRRLEERVQPLAPPEPRP